MPAQPTRRVSKDPQQRQVTKRNVRRYSQPKDDDDDDDNNNRSDGLRQAILNVGQVLTSKDDDNDRIRVGSTVVANSNLAELNIWQFQSYKVQGIWDQGERKNNADDDAADADANNGHGTTAATTAGWVEKIPREYINDPAIPPPAGYTRYVSLYSAKHHEQPVTVQPDEVVLVSLRAEVMDSIRMALPLFGFWTALAISFAVKYNERHGGNFVDALMGR